jgi:hypothetical protein
MSMNQSLRAGGAVLLGAALLAALPGPAAAQQQLAAVQGTATDATSAVLPGVVVTVTNQATGVARTATSNARGVYRILSVEPGRYDVSAELQGFRKVVQRDVVLSVGATLGIDFRMEPGGMEETIEVGAVVPDIQTQKADVSAVVEQKKIVDLPLMARNVLQLAGLQPGIQAALPGATGTSDFLVPEQGVGINASGQRMSAVSATVDGTNVDGAPWGGTVLMTPNVESVQEFQVIANNQSAEYGRNSGASITMVTKGGTNEVHGSVFEFHRNEGMRTLNHFEKLAKQTNPRFEKPDMSRNDFGASIGGPLRKNRTFFFASYEGLRETNGRGVELTVETRELVDFVQRTRPNSIAAQLFRNHPPAAYPTTNLRDLGSPAPGANRIGPPDGIPDVGTVAVSTRDLRDGDQFNVRLDHHFPNGRDRLRATYYLSRLRPEGWNARPTFIEPFPHRNQFLNLAHTRTLSATALNELAFGFWRMHGEAGDPTPEVPTIGVGGGVPGYGVTFWWPITFTQNNFQLKDTLTLHRGTHSFRMGGEVRHTRDDSHLSHWSRPNYFFNSILDFVDDEPLSETRAVDPATGLRTTAPGLYRTTDFGFFVQDNWKVRPNFTLNLGLRWEVFGSPGKANGAFNAIILGPGATRQEQVRGARLTAVDKLYDTDWNNLGPRFGFSWDPASNGKFVVRGGAGLTYNRINHTVFSDERLNPPQFAQAVTDIFTPSIPIVYRLGPDYPQNPALARGIDERGGIRGARLSLRVIDADVVTPKAYNWFFGFQRELPARFVFDFNYVGSAGRNLMSFDGPGGEDYNRFAGDLLDGRFDGLNPSFRVLGLNESRISSNYHGVTFQLRRRHLRGFSFQAAYTLGKATDTAGSSIEVTRPDLEEGPTGDDVRHRVVLNWSFEAPSPKNGALKHLLGGWQLNAITVYQSGFPLNVFCGAAYPTCDFNADGTNNDRMDSTVFPSGRGGGSNDDYLNGLFRREDFSRPSGQVSNIQRNSFRGPSYFSTDLSLFKNITLGNDRMIQLRVEAFNVLDRVNLFGPVNNWQNTTNFGRSTATRMSREVQLGVKFLF